MADKLKVELQDENGNIYYLHTSADVVFCEDGTTVEAKLNGKIDKADIIQNATTAATDKVPSAAVAKNLQDQITAQNTKLTKEHINLASYTNGDNNSYIARSGDICTVVMNAVLSIGFSTATKVVISKDDFPFISNSYFFFLEENTDGTKVSISKTVGGDIVMQPLSNINAGGMFQFTFSFIL